MTTTKVSPVLAAVLAVALVSLSACGVLIGLRDVDPGGPDAALDAPTDAPFAPPPDASSSGTDAASEASTDGGCDADLMTSPTSCGRCGHDCLGAGCDGGHCGVIVLAPAEPHPNAIVVSEGAVYWGNFGDYENPPGNVRQMPVTGGDAQTIAPARAGVFGLAVHQGTNVYYADGPPDGGLRTVPSGGGTIRTLDLAGGEFATLIALKKDGTEVASIVGTNVVSSPVDQTKPGMILGTVEFIGGLAADDTHVYWSTTGAVYTLPAGVIYKGSFGVDTPDATFITGQYYPSSLVVDGNDLFWVATSTDTLDGNSRLVRADVTTGQVTTLSARFFDAAAIAVDATHIYFALRHVDGAVMSCPRSGCGTASELAVTLATGLSEPTAIALDENAVYVAVQGTFNPPDSGFSGSIVKVAK